MPAYAIGHFRNMKVNREVLVYLKRIDATLEPFEGRFLVHGSEAETVEGESADQIVIIEFPDLEHAKNWYHSDAYQNIVKMRTANCEGSVALVEGVPPGYQAADLLRG